jgi:hypothetical protein
MMSLANFIHTHRKSLAYIIKLLHEYFKVMIVMGAKSLNAPFLKVSNDFPFEVVP